MRLHNLRTIRPAKTAGAANVATSSGVNAEANSEEDLEKREWHERLKYFGKIEEETHLGTKYFYRPPEEKQVRKLLLRKVWYE